MPNIRPKENCKQLKQIYGYFLEIIRSGYNQFHAAYIHPFQAKTKKLQHFPSAAKHNTN